MNKPEARLPQSSLYETQKKQRLTWRAEVILCQQRISTGNTHYFKHQTLPRVLETVSTSPFLPPALSLSPSIQIQWIILLNVFSRNASQQQYATRSAIGKLVLVSVSWAQLTQHTLNCTLLLRPCQEGDEQEKKSGQSKLLCFLWILSHCSQPERR